MTAMSTRAKIGVVVASAVLLGSVAAGYVAMAAEPAPPPPAAGDQAVTLTPGPRLLAITDRYVSTVATADPAGSRTVSGLECLRVYAAAGTGVCLKPETAWSYQMVVLDAALRETRAISVPGLPNRARVSASGRMVSWTTFVGGDSYTASGFSTRTGILDTTTGVTVASLEEFAITRDGRSYRHPDVNFWGVTFTADDNRFYATMSTGGRRYLVGVTSRPVRSRRCRRTSSARRCHRTAPGSRSRRRSTPTRRRVGVSRSSTWRPCGSPRRPRRPAWTTRRPGSTAPRWPTRCGRATAARTCGASRPTGQGHRSW